MRHVKLLILSSVALTAVVAYSSHTLQAADPVKERQAAMEQVNDAMKVLGAMGKREVPFDAATVRKNASTIADTFKAAGGLFPAGSGGGESRAKPEVWSDAAGFAKALKDGREAAEALRAVKDEAAPPPGPVTAWRSILCGILLDGWLASVNSTRSPSRMRMKLPGTSPPKVQKR